MKSTRRSIKINFLVKWRVLSGKAKELSSFFAAMVTRFTKATSMTSCHTFHPFSASLLLWVVPINSWASMLDFTHRSQLIAMWQFYFSAAYGFKISWHKFSCFCFADWNSSLSLCIFYCATSEVIFRLNSHYSVNATTISNAISFVRVWFRWDP